MRTLDVPLFSFAIRSQDKCTLSRTHEYSHFAHRSLLLLNSRFRIKALVAPPPGRMSSSRLHSPAPCAASNRKMKQNGRLALVSQVPLEIAPTRLRFARLPAA